MASVRDKVVIVTGSGQGLGRAYAEALAAEGAKVVVAEINTRTGEEVVGAIRQERGEAIFIATDVTSYSSVQSMVETVITKYGRIDALVNNAAIYHGLRVKPFTEISEEEWDKLMAVNLKGVWNCSRAVLPHMLRQGKGKIVNVASSLAFEGGGFLSHYATSKGGVVSLTRAISQELPMLGGAEITVNSLCPGAVWDEATEGIASGEEGLERVLANQSLKRKGTVQDLAGPLLFLVSDDSNFMTGTAMVVDGGASRH